MIAKIFNKLTFKLSKIKSKVLYKLFSALSVKCVMHIGCKRFVFVMKNNYKHKNILTI